MTERGPFNERKCGECGQMTLTQHWQEVNYCGACGVEFDSLEDDRQEHFAVGLSLSHDQVDRLIDGEEVTLTRAVSDDRQLTVNLIKSPP